MNDLQLWLVAIRPKTLSLSVMPVILGTALAYAHTQSLLWLPLVAAVVAAALIQIGTNLHNDVSDFEKGTDTTERLGPLRVTAQGLITPARVYRAAMLSFALAFMFGIYLVIVGGWPILLLGLVSLAAGAAYSAGPYPVSDYPAGELFVLLFFGLAAVGGSYYLQTADLSPDVLPAGAALGSLAAAVLLVNNYRDSATDALSGRRTLAVLAGDGPSRVIYALLLLAPYALLLLLNLPEQQRYSILLPGLTLPWALFLIHCMHRWPKSRQLNLLLARTAQLQVGFAGLLALGVVL